MKKLLLVLVLLSLTLAGAAYGWHWWRQRQSERIAYTVEKVERGSLDETVSASGRVRPREVFIVGSEVAGKVVAVLADYNQTVREGDVLLRLDDRLARARLEKADIAIKLARAAVRQAEAQRDGVDAAYKRLRAMSSEVRSKFDLDIAHTKFRAAQEQVKEANLKVQEAEEARRQADLALRLTTVRAPVVEPVSSLNRPGIGMVSEQSAVGRGKRTFVVLERKVSVNQEIGAALQGHLFTLASDLQHMRVTVQVGEGDIDKVRRGMAARFTVGGGDNEPKYSGGVDDIHLMPKKGEGIVYFEVEIDVDNQRDRDSGEWKLRPGLTASVDIIRRSHAAVWKVPSAALTFEPAAKQQSEAARAKLARRTSLEHSQQWQTVWVRGADGKPWPIFVRTGGSNARGQSGIQDDHCTEALEWDEEVKDAAALEVIINAPPPKKGIFNITNVKL